MGLLDDPDLGLNLGLGLLQAGGRNLAGQGNIGTALQGALGNYYGQKQAKQQLALGNLNLMQQQQEMPMRMDYLKALGQKLHIANTDPGITQQLASGGLMGQTAQAAPPSLMTVGGNGAPQPSAAPGASPSPTQASQGDDPMDLMRVGAFGDALGMKGAEGLQKLGAAQLQYDPATATRMAYAKSEIAQDEMALRNASSPGAQQAAYVKYLKDAGLLNIGQFNGNVTTLGGITPQQLGVNTFSPQTGIQTVGGQASLVPGYAGAAQGKAAAESVGKAAGETIELTDPNTGTKYTVPKTVIVGGGATAPRNGGAVPGSGNSGATAPLPSTGGAPPGSVSGLGPARETMLKGNATDALKTNQEFQGQAEGAQQMLAQVQALRSAASQFTPGQFADARAKMLNYLNSTGLISKDQIKSLGSYQEGQKIAIQLQAAATKQLGSREAAQVFQFMGKSLPNLTLSENGLEKVSSWQEGISRYNIARAQQANQAAQNQDAGRVNSMRDTWIANSNPLFYVMASARPDVRQELLNSLGDQKQKFVAQWNAAARAGYAPRPNEYTGQ